MTKMCMRVPLQSLRLKRHLRRPRPLGSGALLLLFWAFPPGPPRLPLRLSLVWLNHVPLPMHAKVGAGEASWRNHAGYLARMLRQADWDIVGGQPRAVSWRSLRASRLQRRLLLRRRCAQRRRRSVLATSWLPQRPAARSGAESMGRRKGVRNGRTGIRRVLCTNSIGQSPQSSVCTGTLTSNTERSYSRIRIPSALILVRAASCVAAKSWSWS